MSYSKGESLRDLIHPSMNEVLKTNALSLTKLIKTGRLVSSQLALRDFFISIFNLVHSHSWPILLTFHILISEYIFKKMNLVLALLSL